MIFNVPLIKDENFNIKFFYFFSDCIDQIASENNKWPDKITFIGNIGLELVNIINEKGWDFKKFNITNESSIVDKIVIEYSKPIDEISNTGYINGDSLTGKTVEGFPGSDTMSKINNHSLNMNFTIERKIRPKLEIRLKR